VNTVDPQKQVTVALPGHQRLIGWIRLIRLIELVRRLTWRIESTANVRHNNILKMASADHKRSAARSTTRQQKNP